MRVLSALAPYTALVFALAIMALGMVAMLNAGLGTQPWEVLHLGLAQHTFLSHGQIIIAIGLGMVMVSWAMKVKPYIGTVMNIILIGLFVDLYVNARFVPQPSYLGLSLLQLAIGIAIFAYGTAIHVLCRRGLGPRDSFMLALSGTIGLRVGATRTVIEVVVTLAGSLLGGPVGIGTVVFALAVGPLLEIFLKVGRLQVQGIRQYVLARLEAQRAHVP